MLSLGTYPDTPLLEARKQCDTARQQLAQGVNPAAERQRKRNPIDRSFEGVAGDWLACVLKLVLAGKRSRDTYEKAKNQLEGYIIPELGREDVNSIRPSQLLPVFKRIEAKGLLETARRTKQRCGQVFRQGIGLGLCERDIASDFRGLLEAPTVEHHAAITDPAAVSALLCKIDRYAGRALTRLALKFSPLVFVRPHNLRKARWLRFFGSWKHARFRTQNGRTGT